MTNGEKYLKDGVDLEQLDKELIDYICNQGTDNPYYTYVSDFFKEQVKPTLTEDERVILRNLRDKYKYIGREGMLYIAEQERNSNFVSQVVIDEYKFGLFQFIKERRRILY